MKKQGQSSVFGRRKEPHTVIIAHGDKLKHFTVRPWLVATLGTAFATLALGYLVATSYLVLRDDLIGASVARQARMQQAYEDRISALRAQVDRITSRQLLDQQLVETKVGELLQRQTELTARHKSLAPLIDGLTAESALPVAAPVPGPKPDVRASGNNATTGALLAYADATSTTSLDVFKRWSTRQTDAGSQSAADRADMMFVAINRSLRTIESDQMNKLDTLANSANQTAEAIGVALQDAGLKVDTNFGQVAVGGPYLPADGEAMFDSKVKELDSALGKLDALKKQARKLPLSSPAKDWAVTSSFGSRSDPFLGAAAFHGGMDFRAPTGSPIKATAAGVVVKAGWSGGYGRLVEVDHGNGYSTRYGHMSKILVSEGDKIKLGEIVGLVGSSGRSTGPHLHYEVRKNGTAVDPLRYIKAGKRIARYLATL